MHATRLRGLAPLALGLALLTSACGGGASAPRCTTPADCPGTDGACQARTCVGGACGLDLAPAGPAAVPQQPGDCREQRCDGRGALVDAVDDGDLPTVGNPCVVPACHAGVPSAPPAGAGTPCGAGLTCDGAGTCPDPCSPNPCAAPPASSCNGDVVTAFPVFGTCAPQVGGGAACDYTPDVFDCTRSGTICLLGACVDPPIATSLQIADLRRQVDACSIPPCNYFARIDRATVTYLRPAAPLGLQAGFYVQAERGGPGLFVSVDPATLQPPPAPGDLVSFMVVEATVANGVLTAGDALGWQRLLQGLPLAPLTQDLSAAPDLWQAGLYTSLLATASGAVIGPFTASDFSTVAAPVETAALPGGQGGLSLVTTAAVRDALDLVDGCRFEVGPSPVDQRDAVVRLAAWTTADLRLSGCPAPRLVRAQPVDGTHVTLSFDRNLAPASVAADGHQFAISAGGVASVAVAGVTVLGRQVVLTTSPLTPSVVHVVSVDATVLDPIGSGVDPAANSASFQVASAGCTATVVLSQVYGGGNQNGAAWDADFVELHNRTGVTIDLAGWSLQYASAGGSVWLTTPLAGIMPAGGYLLVKVTLGGTSAFGQPLPTPDLTWGNNLSSTAGKVALVRSTTPLSGACPSGAEDLLGWGPTASCAEGSQAPATSVAFGLQRGGAGCDDTDVNAADFVLAAPAPRNAATPPLTCPCDAP